MRKHLTEKEKTEFKYLIELISSSVNSTKAPKPYDGIDWQSIFMLANYCSVESAVAYAVQRIDKSLVDASVREKFAKDASLELLIDGNVTFEAEKILSAFDKNNVKNMPLKGYFMKKEYPRSDFRSVSDIDILFDRKQVDTVKKVFDELGYTFLLADDNQYHFEKKPFINIEMHATLVHKQETYYPFLVNQLDRGIKRDNYLCSYNMTPEDYYIYMLVHSSNHFRIGGMGLRMVLDAYVFLKNHSNMLDYVYLNDKLKKMQLTVFEERIRKIAFNWFAKPNPIITFDDLEEYILLSGTLGTTETATMVNSHKAVTEDNKSKLSYAFSSLFPSLKIMSYKYEYLKKAPFLLPFSWCQMWCRRIFVEHNVNFKSGLKNRLSYDADDIEMYKSLISKMGFDGIGINNHE